jgi:Lon protease-like protein
MVMFPHVLAPLHIFEERYKLLINRSIDESLAFGIVLNTPGASAENESTISRIGTSVRVVEFERLDGGRLNIMVSGEKRFEILQLTGNKPYWTAQVEFLEDDGAAGSLDESFQSVARLYREVHSLASQLRGGEPTEIRLPDSPAALSYLVSYVLDLPWSAKQELLEMSSTADRLQAAAVHLEEIRRHAAAQIARNKVAGKPNGNGRNGHRS